jgi:hypothetical protein
MMAIAWALDDRTQLHKDANALLTQNMSSGERVIAIIRGSFDSALIATDRRAFIFKKGFFSGATFGKKLASYDYLNLTGVQLETGAVSGVLSLQGPGISSQDVSYWAGGKNDPRKAPHALALIDAHFEQARVGVARLRELISAAQSTGSMPVAVGPDVADQLRKVGELRDAGVLTEDEFRSKKAELLARM